MSSLAERELYTWMFVVLNGQRSSPTDSLLNKHSAPRTMDLATGLQHLAVPLELPLLIEYTAKFPAENRLGSVRRALPFNRLITRVHS